MARSNLKSSVADQSCTHLQVEAITKECVNAAIHVANENERTLILRVLPEQVGSGPSNPGYLGFAGIADFVSYVKSRDVGGFIHLCRAGFGCLIAGANSISDVKISLRRDLDAGVEFFHVDASRKLSRLRAWPERIELELELMQFISIQSANRGNSPIFEIGGSGSLQGANDIARFSTYIDTILEGCERLEIEEPTFASAQTGTSIRELSNVAASPRPFSFENEEGVDTQLAETADLAGFRGISLIAHDCDYLGGDYLGRLFQQGVAIACIGQEMGTHETQVFLQLCDATRAASIRQDFLSLALSSKAWESSIAIGSCATEFEKAILAGHHVFATEEFKSIKARLQKRCGATGISSEQTIRESHATRIVSVLRHLGSRSEIPALPV